MDKTINRITSLYVKKLYDNLNPKAIYLFGSYAKGTQNEHSDIDIAIVFEDIESAKYMEIYGKLWAIASSVDCRLEPKLLIDDGENDKYSFLHEVKTTGLLIS